MGFEDEVMDYDDAYNEVMSRFFTRTAPDGHCIHKRSKSRYQVTQVIRSGGYNLQPAVIIVSQKTGETYWLPVNQFLEAYEPISFAGVNSHG